MSRGQALGIVEQVNRCGADAARSQACERRRRKGQDGLRPDVIGSDHPRYVVRAFKLTCCDESSGQVGVREERKTAHPNKKVPNDVESSLAARTGDSSCLSVSPVPPPVLNDDTARDEADDASGPRHSLVDKHGKFRIHQPEGSHPLPREAADISFSPMFVEGDNSGSVSLDVLGRRCPVLDDLVAVVPTANLRRSGMPVSNHRFSGRVAVPLKRYVVDVGLRFEVRVAATEPLGLIRRRTPGKDKRCSSAEEKS